MKTTDRAWAPFLIGDIFDYMKRGKRLKRADHVAGHVPYVSSTSNSNGVDGFITPPQKARLFSDCISLANSGSVGAAFYEPFEYVASDHVTCLKRDNCNPSLYLFLATVLKKQKNNFGFNREIKDDRLKRMQVMLPVCKDGTPDFSFMEEYADSMIKKKRARSKTVIKNTIALLSNEEGISGINWRDELNSCDWSPFRIGKLFDCLEAGKSKGLTHLNKVDEGGIQYISATNRNNGVSCFVENTHRSVNLIQNGKCVGFIKNGDGSAGYAVYKEAPFIATSDVIFGYANFLNKYTGLFFVAAQDMIQNKYSHGHKRNKEHLSKDSIMLPVKDGEPDFQLMEKIGKAIALGKYKDYINYIERNGA